MNINQFYPSVTSRVILFVIFLQSFLVAGSIKAQDLIVENLTGPITANELTAFKNFIANYNPNSTQNHGNVWVFGSRGKAIEACGLMYEATKDLTILNRMIYYSDLALAGRNDLAPANKGGQRIAWTGAIEPIWPVSADGIATGAVEPGSVVGHMAFCAKLILQNPSIWDINIPIGDPNGFGATYKQRALKYIAEGDYVMDKWLIPRFVKTSDRNRIYFPGPPNEYQPLSAAPWNQLFMVTNGLVRLAECHVLLNDAPARVTQYDAIVKPNLDWFFSSLTPRTSAVGTPIYKWEYKYQAHTEDANHFAYDAEGLWIAYNSGRYGIKFADLVPFANTYIDVILATIQPGNGRFAGRVDGTTPAETGNSSGDNYVRDEYYYLADFRPDKYEFMANININVNRIRTYVQGTARILWQKQRRYLASLPNDTQAPATPVLVSPQNESGASQNNGVELSWLSSTQARTYKIYLGISEANFKLLAEVPSTSYTVMGLEANTRYYWKVEAVNSIGTASSQVFFFNTLFERITGNGGILTAQYTSSKPTENYTYLNDLNTSTKYYISQTALWVQYQSPVPAKIASYEIASANDTPLRDPKNWELLGSTNGIDWTIIDTRENQVFSDRFVTKNYEINNTAAYTYFKLNITANSGAPHIQLSEWNLYGTSVKKEQNIIFEALGEKTLGDADFEAGATSDSGLEVAYSSDNEEIAEIINNKIRLTGIGTVTITASQAGNAIWAAATEVSQVLIVAAPVKQAQTIAFDALAEKNFFDADFDAGGTASSGLEITYTSSNPDVAVIQNGKIHITGSGITTIAALQEGNDFWLSAPVISQTLNVIFTLPASNFRISRTDETCTTADNGSINITATKTLNYSVAITGNNVNLTKLFTNTAETQGLASGKYAVCITVEGQSNYQQCFEVHVSEPRELTVYSNIDKAGNSLTLTMDGGDAYHIELNGINYNTQQNEITIPLKEGSNLLKVTTDKLCQGIIEKQINFSEDILLYPNPFNELLNIRLERQNQSPVRIEVNTLDGKQVFSNQFFGDSQNIQLNMQTLPPAMYTLKIISDQSESIHKIVKR